METTKREEQCSLLLSCNLLIAQKQLHTLREKACHSTIEEPYETGSNGITEGCWVLSVSWWLVYIETNRLWQGASESFRNEKKMNNIRKLCLYCLLLVTVQMSITPIKKNEENVTDSERPEGSSFKRYVWIENAWELTVVGWLFYITESETCWQI